MLQTTTEAASGHRKAQTMPRVRTATPADFDQLMALCRAMHAENGVSNADWSMVASVIMAGLNQDASVIGVIGEPGRIEGAIYLQMSRFWYSSDTIIDEIFSYVLPDYRRSNNAKALIDFAKRCSDRLKVPLLVSVISNERTEAKVKLYGRRLGPSAGAFFLVNATTGR